MIFTLCFTLIFNVENFFVGDCGSMWEKVYTFTLNLISSIDNK